MKLTLLAIMQDEAPLVDRWVAGTQRVRSAFDEVVVVDGGSTDGTVEALAARGIVAIVRPFANDFADQRNFGLDRCTANWVLELDADEIPSAPLLHDLRRICHDADQDGVDCIGIPRLNFHDGRLQPGPGHRGLDYQYRLHRRHCRWTGRVHEEMTGSQARIELDVVDGRFIVHMKSQARFDERNAMYARIAQGVPE